MSKRLPADQRKKIIIRSAISVFAETNYRVAKVAEIAKLSGVTEPMIYKHFHSKEDLFIEVLSKMGKNTLKLFVTFQNEASGSLKQKLKTIIKRHLTSLQKYEKELQIFYQAISEIHVPEIKEVLLDCYQSYADFFHGVITKSSDNQKKNMQFHDTSWEVVGL